MFIKKNNNAALLYNNHRYTQMYRSYSYNVLKYLNINIYVAIFVYADDLQILMHRRLNTRESDNPYSIDNCIAPKEP